MLSRTTLVMVIVLFASSLPFSANSNGKRQPPQNPSLEIFTSHVSTPRDRITLRLSGSYRKAAGTVRLRAITVRDRRRSRIAHARGKSIQPTPSRNSNVSAVYHHVSGASQNPAPLEGNDPGYNYYYTQGEMTKSDGTVLVSSNYQYDSAASQNVFNISLAGISLSFDLNTQQQLSPVSDEALEQVEAWLNSNDGQLARETGIALIQQGQQQPDNELLLIYYLVALTVGDDSTTQAIFKISDQREKSIRTHHASGVVESTFKSAPCNDAFFRE